ncbi:MAG: Rieske (2Fe-2S) protein [Acidimicrobiales bacterium]
MRVSAGLLEELPRNRCVTVVGGAAVVARTGDEVVAFQNQCLHQCSALEGGLVQDDVLICPMHFWRYRLPAGRHVATGRALPTYPTELIDGEVWVDVPDAAPRTSMRELLLQHARDWRPGS